MAQSSIDFLLSNNIAIIQGVFAIIFILVVFVILRSFKKDSEEHVPPRPTTIRERREEEARVEKKAEATPKAEALSNETSPLDDLDNLDDLMGPDIKEVSQAEIDQTLSAPAAPPQPEVNIPPPSDFVEAAKTSAPSELTSALNEKEKVIADLKAEIKSLQERAPAAVGGESPDLQSKVKELTEKLSEYEIIEDDIANLSFYKTENTKLKNELEKLRGTSSAKTEAAIASIDAPPAETPAPPPATPPVEAATPAPAPTPPPAAPAAPEPENSVLNEFEEAVKQKEALEKNLPPAEAKESISVSSTESDLLKEFENAVEKELAVPAPAPVDTPTPAKAAEPTPDINSDKLVQEVETLASTKAPEASDDGKDSNQKLIEEFENFVNKN